MLKEKSMLYKVKYVDNSEELVEAETIAEARKEARCLFDCPVRHIVVQQSGDDDELEPDAGKSETAEDEDEDDESDEGDDEDDDEEEEEDK
jgi:hypothetical protein